MNLHSRVEKLERAQITPGDHNCLVWMAQSEPKPDNPAERPLITVRFYDGDGSCKPDYSTTNEKI